MKKILITPLLVAVVTHLSVAQMNCGQAVQQLQTYAMQVNQIYANEYWTIIPNQRCPAYDNWGNAFNPVVVQNCRAQMLANLNYWYGTQCTYVNNWHASIARSCTDDGSRTKPAPEPEGGEVEEPEIDTEAIEELSVDVDTEKVVKIKIPKTAAGFKGNQY